MKTGRQEHNDATDIKAKRLLVGQPKIMEEYFYSFTDKTSSTKYEYIRHAIEFLNYMVDIGFDPSNINNFTKVKKIDIDKYLDKIRYRYVNGNKKEASEGYRAFKYYAVASFFEFLVDNNYIINNPCERVKPPKVNVEKEIVAMTAEEIDQLKINIINGVGSQKSMAEHAKWINRDLAIVTLGCSTGLRVSSISEINISDINFEKGSIVVREKGNKERNIYIGQNTIGIIQKWIEDRNRMYPNIETDALFVSRLQRRISQKQIHKLICMYSKSIGKHITPHKMRSSCATNLYEKTGDIYLVANVLGHKNIANTRRYARISEEKRRAAVEILDNL